MTIMTEEYAAGKCDQFDGPTAADWRDYELWSAREEAMAEHERAEREEIAFARDRMYERAGGGWGHGYGPDEDLNPADWEEDDQ